MKRSWGLFVIICTLLAATALSLSLWSAREYNKKPEFSPLPEGQIVETIPDPGIPDVTGRKKGLVQLSAFPGMFKSDKERREWLSKWAQDKETKDWVKDGPTSSLSPHPQSTEGVFGEHRIVPTIGGAEDEAPFYPDVSSTPVEYAGLYQGFNGEWWHGGSRVIIIPDEDCACVCCPCCPCPNGMTEEDVFPPIKYLEPPTKLYPPVEPPVWPPIIPPIDPPVDPPKVPEASTMWMLIVGLVAIGMGCRI